MRTMVTIGLLLLCSTTFAGEDVAQPAAKKVMRNDRVKLEKGEVLVETEVVKGQEIPRARIRAIIDAPPAVLWAIIRDCNGYTKTMNNIAQSKQLSSKGNQVVCEVTADLPFPISDLRGTTRATHTIEKNIHYKREWTLIEGDYSRNEGKWELFAVGEKGEKTLLLYELFAVPNMTLPDFLLKAVTVRALPRTIEKLREQVEKKG
ncbi:MAG: hypothetical protein GY822_31305 [Deltaproteobacteria bacterium]|nr:hypothetical protein [Deltaproteobacteria bacterium]